MNQHVSSLSLPTLTITEYVSKLNGRLQELKACNHQGLVGVEIMHFRCLVPLMMEEEKDLKRRKRPSWSNPDRSSKVEDHKLTRQQIALLSYARSHFHIKPSHKAMFDFREME